MITQYAQFVLCGGPDGKVPVNARGENINPHNPANWLTHEQALATGQPLGFVFTDADPFFFIDLDKCREGDRWSDAANEILAYFPGALVEVSKSGNGLHIIGSCDKSYLLNKRNKFNGWIEFYIRERFVAFGHGWQGDATIDFTKQLFDWLPEREIIEGTLADGPVPEYTGPEDDAVLIEKMLNSAGSIASMFGNGLKFEHLWKADAAMLCQAFPSPSGDVWDRSSADFSLMMHLAFWTGKDAGRMDRLFRMSGLMRDKYEKRADYRRDTVSRCIGSCKKVYDVQKKTAVANTQQTDQAIREFLTIPDQMTHFAGCVYVCDMHRVMIPNGEMLKPEQFNVIYGGHTFAMTPNNDGTPSKKAFEAFTENRAWQFPKVATTTFRPDMQPGAIIGDKVNNYYPVNVDMQPGDVTPFLDLLQKLLPNERDRQILLTYLARQVQKQGSKFQWSVVLQGVEGNGKTMIAKCVEYAIGERYCYSPDAKKLANQFNAYIAGKLFMIVEEVHMEGRRDLLDTMKPLITNNRVEVEPKGVDGRMVDNFANWFFCTNHRDAILKSQNDRRYCIFFTAQQHVTDLARDGMLGSYFPSLWNWLKGDGFKYVAHFLMNYQAQPEFDPVGLCHRAPDTSTTGDVIRESLGRAEQEIMEACDTNQPGFANGWISSLAVERLMTEKRVRMSPQKRGQMIKSLGYQPTMNYENGRSPIALFNEDTKRPILYNRWGYGTVEEYAAAQGYAVTTMPT